MRDQSEDVQYFLRELKGLCERHGLALSHEDRHGGFIVQPLDAADGYGASGMYQRSGISHREGYFQWLLEAADGTKEAQQ